MANAQEEPFTSSRPTPVPLHVVVIGAGIGGLSLAILLAQSGHRVTAIDRKPSYEGISSGGGINVTANAIYCLELMGIGKKLPQFADKVTEITVRRYATGEAISKRKSASANVMLHRHDLLTALYARATEIGVAVEFEKHITNVDFGHASPVLEFRDKENLSADVVVAADGVNSMARKLLFPNVDVEATPTSDCVFMVDVPGNIMRSVESTKQVCNSPTYSLWVGPGRSIVSWRMTTRDTYHLQFSEHEYHQGEAYGGEPETGAFISRYENMDLFKKRWSDFHESIGTIISAVDSCIKWRIATATPLPSWSGHNGRFILLGDAAHVFPPFAGQGAAMAIEDATCLATLFEHVRTIGDMADVARVYEEVRRPRVNKIHQIVVSNIAMFSMYDGEKQIVRDKGLQNDMVPARSERNLEIEQEPGQTVGSYGSSQRRGVIDGYDAVQEARNGWQASKTKL